MSPAPVRARDRQKFPHSWGYWLGLFLMLAGVTVAIVLSVNAVRGFRNDVNDLRRAVNVDTLQVDLERGEYLVFDEDGVDLGPFDVRVIRSRDGLEVPTAGLVDGTTYDVDGQRGKAKVAFDVPTSDTYRVEVDTSLGSITRFAVGGDVGNDRANRVIQGLVAGAVLFILGFVAIVWTLAVHARWRLRSEITDRASSARDVLSSATAPVETADGRRSTAADATDRATSWARERIDRARESVATVPNAQGRTSTLRETVAGRAQQLLDSADSQLDAAEPIIGEAAASADTPADMASRIDDALSRVQERVARGDNLRDIAADERVAAEAAAAELAAQGRQAQDAVIQQAAGLESQILEQTSGQLSRLQADAAALGLDTVDQAAAELDTTGQELIGGAAVAAGGALAAGTEAARIRAREAVESTSALPAPPALDAWQQHAAASSGRSARPAPWERGRSTPPPAPPPLPPASLDQRQGGTAAPAAPTMTPAAPARTEPPAPPPVRTEPPAPPPQPDPVPSAPRAPVADPVAIPTPTPAPAAETGPRFTSSAFLAPPPAIRPLARRDAGAGSANLVPETTTVTARPSGFTGLAPPPVAVVRPVENRSADAHDMPAEDVPPAAEPSAEENQPQAKPATPRKFSMAPPPDYTSKR